MEQMILDGISKGTEVGPGKVLQGLFKKIDSNTENSFFEERVKKII